MERQDEKPRIEKASCLVLSFSFITKPNLFYMKRTLTLLTKAMLICLVFATGCVIIPQEETEDISEAPDAPIVDGDEQIITIDLSLVDILVEHSDMFDGENSIPSGNERIANTMPAPVVEDSLVALIKISNLTNPKDTIYVRPYSTWGDGQTLNISLPIFSDYKVEVAVVDSLHYNAVTRTGTPTEVTYNEETDEWAYNTDNYALPDSVDFADTRKRALLFAGETNFSTPTSNDIEIEIMANLAVIQTIVEYPNDDKATFELEQGTIEVKLLWNESESSVLQENLDSENPHYYFYGNQTEEGDLIAPKVELRFTSNNPEQGTSLIRAAVPITSLVKGKKNTLKILMPENFNQGFTIVINGDKYDVENEIVIGGDD